MAEREVAVATFRVYYDCDECGEPMQFSGVALPMSPRLYVMVCPNQHKMNSTTMYPAVRYKVIEI